QTADRPKRLLGLTDTRDDGDGAGAAEADDGPGARAGGGRQGDDDILKGRRHGKKNGTRMTRMRRILTDQIRADPSDPCHPCPVMLWSPTCRGGPGRRGAAPGRPGRRAAAGTAAGPSPG